MNCSDASKAVSTTFLVDFITPTNSPKTASLSMWMAYNRTHWSKLSQVSSMQANWSSRALLITLSSRVSLELRLKLLLLAMKSRISLALFPWIHCCHPDSMSGDVHDFSGGRTWQQGSHYVTGFFDPSLQAWVTAGICGRQVCYADCAMM